MHDVSIKDVRAFLMVAAAQSFSRAASNLGLSPSALTVAIKELERKIGCPLFDRSTRVVALTPAGAAFVPVAERLLSDFNKAISDLISFSERQHGRVAIGAAASVISLIIADAVADLSRKETDIEIRVVEDTTERLAARALTGEVDFGITTLWTNIEALTSIPFLSDRMGALFPADHPRVKSRKALEWKELRQFPLVALATGAGIRSQLERDPQIANVLQKANYEVSTISALTSFVRSGVGLSIIPAMIARTLDQKAFVFRPLVRPTAWRRLFFVRGKQRPLNPAAQVMLQLIIKRLFALRTTENIKPNFKFDLASSAKIDD